MDANPSAMFETAQSQSRMHENQTTESLRAFKREDDDNNKRKAILKVPSHGKARRIKKYYNRQNALIDAYLNSADEEAAEAEDTVQNGWKVKLAINGSFSVNFFLFIIQMYAAISTGSLSLFGTAADAFMDLVSSIVMLITSKLAAKPNIRKFPVGRKRVETVGIILFCALMTTVAVELISVMFVYCFLIRRYPAAGIFMLDHRNDIFVNAFGLIMSIIGTKFKKVWFLDPIGAFCIACIILFSWASTAFEHMWFLVGKSAPQDFLNKLVYVSVTHDSRIQNIDTARAYHAGDKYYVEVDIIMGQEERLKVTHDVAEKPQRKLEGLADVERAFVHVDYDGNHDVSEEHKPLYELEEPKAPLMERVREKLRLKSRTEEVTNTDVDLALAT
ncbi:hypothetical protein L207DRAFT_628126 [Hyaloscypha variabilis F]|uniref:Cation efflux protein transmembrane domain-containing protein n=1 Tax=Hyaloscypha variabilis (strain UAMH 11265 / GT02V1 / F) TaxID=1149755 RepID=A0A2J6S9Q1_HYAVF|nr:hypothetical protein L207DRAFT_628126 [Hyaloscypha variabilis F]